MRVMLVGDLKLVLKFCIVCGEDTWHITRASGDGSPICLECNLRELELACMVEEVKERRN